MLVDAEVCVRLFTDCAPFVVCFVGFLANSVLPAVSVSTARAYGMNVPRFSCQISM